MCLKQRVVSLGIIVILLITNSCNQQEKSNPTPLAQDIETLNRTENDILDKAKRHIESFLKINATENYTLTHQKAHLDNDTLIDFVFLVNRSEYALKKVKEEKKEDMFEYLGRTGPHNHVFVYLSGEDQLLNTAPIGSAVEYPLTVDFGFLTSPTRKDFWVSYRTRNSMHRNYYTIKNKRLYLTFNCPVFDLIGEPSPKAFAITHKEADQRIAKDIYIYKGVIDNYDPNTIKNVNNYTPDSIIATDDLFVYFFFDEREMVYKTPFKPKEIDK